MLTQARDRFFGLLAGGLLALVIWILFGKIKTTGAKLKPWFYLVGIPGTFTVILAAIAIN
jgi:hypothetical protein